MHCLLWSWACGLLGIVHPRSPWSFVHEQQEPLPEPGQQLVVQVLTGKAAGFIYYLNTIYYYLLFKYCSVTLLQWLPPHIVMDQKCDNLL